MPDQTEKRCNACGAVKPLPQFYRSATCKGGFATVCKRCHIAGKRVKLARKASLTPEIISRWGLDIRPERCREAAEQAKRDLDTARAALRLAEDDWLALAAMAEKYDAVLAHTRAKPPSAPCPDCGKVPCDCL